MGTLLEKAKATPLHQRAAKQGISEDRVELALAVFTGEITWPQAKAALELNDSKSASPGSYLWAALRQAYIRGLLVKAQK